MPANKTTAAFDLDKQTIEDLKIFDEGENSIFGFFNQTKTTGGKNYLWNLMESPLADIEGLKSRVELIQFLSETGFELKINTRQLDLIEHYLKLNIPPLRDSSFDAAFQKILYTIKPSNDYYLIQTGIQQLLYLITHLIEKLSAVGDLLPLMLKEKVSTIMDFVGRLGIADLPYAGQKLSFRSVNKLDYLFRKKYSADLRQLLEILSSLDAYISISQVATQQKLGFPEYSASQKPEVYLTNLYHPLLKGAVPYNVEINESNPLCFLTGPNMAGKSTFLKSLGISIYLSHLGFPVPATKMKTTIYHGISTTINLSDDMSRGYSHFYSEVRRVKEVALKLKAKKNLFVVFDELFRGTNVKDAYDASLVIIRSLANIKNSTFFISTHITEVAEKLQGVRNIQFKCFESTLVENRPVYEYKIRDGISHERLGLHIIENEHIVEILDSIAKD